jgi:fumarate reductase subunit C
MRARSHYSLHHPRWYRPRISTYWWLKRWSYVLFILREISSVFIAWFVVYLLLLIRAVSLGEGRYQEFLDRSSGTAMLVANVVSFAFVLLHTVTWFKVAPQAMAVWMGGRRVPPGLITAAHYGAWAAASVLLALLVLGG